MSVNSSSSNDSVLPSQFPPITHHSLLNMQCLFNKPSSSIFITFSIANIFLLMPLCIHVLYHGFQGWWLKRSTSSAAAAAHSDCFTYHMVTMELITIFGFACICFGIHIHQLNTILAGGLIFIFTWLGETLLQILMCVERYLAVIHPFTYLSLKSERGLRMRNVSIGCVWLLSFGWMALFVLIEQFFIVMFLLLSCIGLAFVSFCSLSVLCVLIRPHPGEQGGGRGRLDRSKLRALSIIVAILCVLVLRFSWALVHVGLYFFQTSHACLIIVCGFWLYLPSSLILPLLFLQRSGKLLCCLVGKTSNEIRG